MVRRHAEEHGQAVVAGDLRRAGSDLDGEALAQAGDVMRQLPSPMRAAEVEAVEGGVGGFTVRTRYSGDETSAVVESQWEEREGRPKIVSMTVV